MKKVSPELKSGPEVSGVYAEAIFNSLQDLDLATAITTLALINGAVVYSLNATTIQCDEILDCIKLEAKAFYTHNEPVATGQNK